MARKLHLGISITSFKVPKSTKFVVCRLCKRVKPKLMGRFR